MKSNPARKVADAASDDLLALSNKLIPLVRKYIKQGLTPERAITRAWNEVGFKRELDDITIKGITNAMSLGSGVKIEPTAVVRNWLLEKYVDTADRIPLSTRLWKNSQESKRIVIDELQKQMKINSSWTATGQHLAETEMVGADLNSQISGLLDNARKAYQGDVAAYSEYRKGIRVAQRYVDRLASNGAPTERLKKAYQNIINATEKGSEDALNKALDRAIRAKARYNADRVSRTEIARAYGDAVKDEALADSDAIGIRVELSSRHKDVDICDFYAEADLYGMGPGVYPKDEMPPYPFHPFDLCALTPVFRGEVGAFDEGGAKAWINKLDAQDKRAVLGVEGYKQYKEDKDTWSDNLKGYNEPEPVTMTFPDSITPP